MELIVGLFSIVLQIAFLGVVVLLITKFSKFKKSSSVHSNILNLQAKLSQLRLALKGKVKKKSNIIRSSFKMPISEGDKIDHDLKKLGDCLFETSEDFQAYFDLSRSLLSLIAAESGSDSAAKMNLENDFMCSDFRIEMDIVRIIKEMMDISSKINVRVVENNRINPSKPLTKVDSLIFTSMVEVNRIFKAEGDNSTFQIDALDDESEKKAS